MNNYKRINWQTGMEITPQVLIDADNFQIEQQNTIRRLQVMPCYGLLPESVFNAEIRIEGNILLINNLIIQAITPQGELIDINEQGKEYAQFDLSQYRQNAQLYINLNYSDLNYSDSMNPNRETLCITPDFNRSSRKDFALMPIAKINNDILDHSYIPPCISINSHQKLWQKFNEIREKISNLLTEIKEQEKYKPILWPLSLLELELNNHSETGNYSELMTPSNLFLLIKKIALHFKLNNSETLEKTEKLLNATYCHTEIYNVMALILDSLCELEEMVKMPIIVEETKPQLKRIQIAVK
ncbi:MAG: type VI secretion system baseplate subunit TssK [Prevotellaceae bacterium]|jgi:predicted component of type VI protein secretion system|nr:type VI secretion system baseplate subunit TssK [Prevotellaceae bacterium]